MGYPWGGGCHPGGSPSGIPWGSPPGDHPGGSLGITHPDGFPGRPGGTPWGTPPGDPYPGRSLGVQLTNQAARQTRVPTRPTEPNQPAQVGLTAASAAEVWAWGMRIRTLGKTEGPVRVGPQQPGLASHRRIEWWAKCLKNTSRRSAIPLIFAKCIFFSFGHHNDGDDGDGSTKKKCVLWAYVRTTHARGRM